MQNIPIRNQCKTCTRRLIEIAYKKSFWFKFFREPLKYLMRLWVWICRYDLKSYEILNENCLNCNRFYKNSLKDKSKLFIFVNDLINPLFDKWLERIVFKDEIIKAKEHAESILKNNEIPKGWNLKHDINNWNKI